MRNSGASFGIDFWGLNILSFVILFVIFLIWKKDKNWGWWLIMLGGLFNLGERLVFGSVHDYWKIPLTNVYNNINDYLIFVGGLVVIWDKWKKLK